MSNVSTMGFMAMQYVETLDGGGEGEVVEESRTKGNHRRVALDCKISTTTGRFRYYSWSIVLNELALTLFRSCPKNHFVLRSGVIRWLITLDDGPLSATSKRERNPSVDVPFSRCFFFSWRSSILFWFFIYFRFFCILSLAFLICLGPIFLRFFSSLFDRASCKESRKVFSVSVTSTRLFFVCQKKPIRKGEAHWERCTKTCVLLFYFFLLHFVPCVCVCVAALHWRDNAFLQQRSSRWTRQGTACSLWFNSTLNFNSHEYFEFFFYKSR